ncbi:MAG: TRAP transporter small permease [Alphaproteobacteria bacterium]|nr:TRAP transporter small permease [Alphaproteobacteria bacterium]
MRSKFGEIVNTFEENLIAIILGTMVMVTFANVVARKAFNSNILWALETTVFLFAWLVLLGVSYSVKTGGHLGVDAIINLVSTRTRRIMALIAAALCLMFTFFLLKGSWDYWAPFANLQPTTGRWFPTGFADVRGQGWYETDDIPMIAPLRFLEGWFNNGDAYEKIPRLIPYMVLPISMALLLFRYIQVTIKLWRGEIDSLIVSHEAEDAVEEAAAKLKD